MDVTDLNPAQKGALIVLVDAYREAVTWSVRVRKATDLAAKEKASDQLQSSILLLTKFLEQFPGTGIIHAERLVVKMRTQ